MVHLFIVALSIYVIPLWWPSIRRKRSTCWTRWYRRSLTCRRRRTRRTAVRSSGWEPGRATTMRRRRTAWLAASYRRASSWFGLDFSGESGGHPTWDVKIHHCRHRSSTEIYRRCFPFRILSQPSSATCPEASPGRFRLGYPAKQLRTQRFPALFRGSQAAWRARSGGRHHDHGHRVPCSRPFPLRIA